MPINIQSEQLLTLEQAAHSLPGHVAPSTTWRWCRVGIRGIRLESVLIGGKRYTSTAALATFAAALTAAAETPKGGDVAVEAQPTRDESMQRRLARAGLLKP